MGKASFVTSLLAIVSLAASPPAAAVPLERAIPELFAERPGADGELRTTLVQGRPPRDEETQRLRLAERFRSLGEALALARAQLPMPTVSGAFAYRWDATVEAFTRQPLSLGSGLAERASTLGRGVVSVGVGYTHADFDTLDGEPLDDLRDRQAALSPGFLAQLPSGDRARYADDLLLARLDARIRMDAIVLAAAYGVSDSIDIGIALSLNHVAMRVRAEARIEDPRGNGGPYFATNQPGVQPVGPGLCQFNFRCAADSVDDSATGSGDIFLRAKWSLLSAAFVDLALVGTVTLPTGNADELLGFQDPTFTPQLVASKVFGRLSPHLNAGYSIRSGDDVSQVQWIAGADVLAAKPLTLYADFLGYHENPHAGGRDDVLQTAMGLKLNPIGRSIVSGSVQLPLNRDGLRADVIGTLALEQSF